jgi:SAM-dependent methyltransferase
MIAGKNTAARSRANYGLDAPGFVKTCLWGGIALLVVGLALIVIGNTLLAGASVLVIVILNIVVILALINACWMVPTAVLMFRSSFVGKFRLRDRLLDDLHLHSDEKVLDVGCGHGLLLIGAASRLPHGRAVGIDLWSNVDQGDNSRAATLANAEAEGVAERVEVIDGDMRHMPFEDASFDAVVASLSIHNIYNREERRKAIQEIVRVLKPQGQVALLDIAHARQYAQDLAACGMQNVRVSGLSFQIYPPARIVTATKSCGMSS